jgi:hypothetical protein
MNNDQMDQSFERVFKLLDVLSVEVALGRNETAGLRKDVEFGFQGVDRRLGKIESRIEALEDQKGRR